MQVLVDQQLLTTTRTRDLMLKMLPEGEDAALWASKLSKILKGAEEGNDMNVVLWQELSTQVCIVDVIPLHAQDMRTALGCELSKHISQRRLELAVKVQHIKCIHD